jgi:hypothetical protein
MALAVWKGTVVAPRFHPIYATHWRSMLKSRFHKTILQSIQLVVCPFLSTEFQAPAPELMEAPCSRTLENKTGHGIVLKLGVHLGLGKQHLSGLEFGNYEIRILKSTSCLPLDTNIIFTGHFLPRRRQVALGPASGSGLLR